MSRSEGNPAVVFMPGLLSGGGAERYAVGLAAALGRSGPVVLATDRGTKQDFQQQFGVDLHDVTIVHLPVMPGWSQRLPHALFTLVEDTRWVRTLKRLRPSVFANCLYTSQVPGIGATNVYVCHFPHRLDRQYSPWSRSAYMKVVGWLRGTLVTGNRSFLAGYDQILANSQFTAGHVQQRWGRRAEVLYPPCPSMLVVGVAKQRRIVVVGRFEEPVAGVPNKRQDILIRAFTELTDLHAQGWELHVAGACPPRSGAYLDRLRRSAGVAPVHFHPNLSFAALKELYSSAKIYWHAQGYGEPADALPETQEHFGITTVEAMSAGAIPVVFDTAGPREVMLPVNGVGRWRESEELLAETRRLAGLTGDELSRLAQDCRARASEFSEHAFQTELHRHFPRSLNDG